MTNSEYILYAAMGNTWANKDKLKALKFSWSPTFKVWVKWIKEPLNIPGVELIEFTPFNNKV